MNIRSTFTPWRVGPLKLNVTLLAGNVANVRTNIILEELEDSIIDSEVDFRMGIDMLPVAEWLHFRRSNRSITQIVWITKRLVIDSGYTVFNLKTRFTLILN